MSQNEEKRPANWWLKESSYTGFFVREISGLFIAIFALNYTAYLFFAAQNMTVPTIITALHLPLAVIGLIAALIHTFTWLPVMPKIVPLNLSIFRTSVAIISLLLVWLAVSYVLLLIL